CGFYVLLGCSLLATNVRAAPGTPTILSTNFDPLCSQTNSTPLPRSPSHQAESTRRMIQRLAEIRKSIDPIKLSFLSDQRARLLEPMIERATNAVEKINLRYSLADTLTEGGNPE